MTSDPASRPRPEDEGAGAGTSATGAGGAGGVSEGASGLGQVPAERRPLPDTEGENAGIDVPPRRRDADDPILAGSGSAAPPDQYPVGPDAGSTGGV